MKTAASFSKVLALLAVVDAASARAGGRALGSSAGGLLHEHAAPARRDELTAVPRGDGAFDKLAPAAGLVDDSAKAAVEVTGGQQVQKVRSRRALPPSFVNCAV